jgi:hypothetical protein
MNGHCPLQSLNPSPFAKVFQVSPLAYRASKLCLKAAAASTLSITIRSLSWRLRPDAEQFAAPLLGDNPYSHFPFPFRFGLANLTPPFVNSTPADSRTARTAAMLSISPTASTVLASIRIKVGVWILAFLANSPFERPRRVRSAAICRPEISSVIFAFHLAFLSRTPVAATIFVDELDQPFRGVANGIDGALFKFPGRLKSRRTHGPQELQLPHNPPLSLSKIKSEHSDGVIHRTWYPENAPNGLNSLRYRRILVQREVCPRAVVILHIRKEYVAQVPLAKDNDMIRTFPSDRANQPFRVAVLPWRV